MPEPISLTIAAVAAPTLTSLSKVISALKEPLGKKKVEEMRSDIANAMDEISTQIKLQQEQIEKLSAQLAYLQLPFWKRWFTKRPQK